jgi:hypothetical protein
MENILERLELRGVPINSDDFPVLEFQILSNDPPAAGRAKKDFYRMIKNRMGDESEDLFLARASVLYALKSHLISAYAVKLRSDRGLSAKFKRRIAQAQDAESGAPSRH